MPTTTISTVGSGARDYSDFSVWEGATDNDLVTSDTIEIGEMYADSTYTTSSRLYPIGGVTDSTRYRIFRAASGEGYNPITDTGCKIEFSGATSLLRLREDYFKFGGIGCFVTSGSSTRTNCINIETSIVGAEIFSCFIHSAGDTDNSQSVIGISGRTGSNNCEFRNCIITSTSGTGFSRGINMSTGNNNIIRNCLVFGLYPTDLPTTKGISGSTTATGCSAINTVCIDNQDQDWDSDLLHMANCADSDGTCSSTSAVGAVIENCISFLTSGVWEDPGREVPVDFTISTDSDLYEAGRSLAGDLIEEYDFWNIVHGDATGVVNIGPYDGPVVAIVGLNNAGRNRFMIFG